LIVAGTPVRDIVSILAEEFEVDVTTAAEQTMALVEELFEQGLVER
jgi:hypothetical protein